MKTHSLSASEIRYPPRAKNRFIAIGRRQPHAQRPAPEAAIPAAGLFIQQFRRPVQRLDPDVQRPQLRAVPQDAEVLAAVGVGVPRVQGGEGGAPAEGKSHILLTDENSEFELLQIEDDLKNNADADIIYWDEDRILEGKRHS